MAKRATSAIITCAPTGAIHTPTMSPALPVTPTEIAEAALGAAVAGAVAALLVFVANRPDGQTDTAGSTAAPSTPAPTSAEESTEPEPTTPSAAETTEDGPVTAAEIRSFLGDYYALLPGNPDAAYARTGPTLRGISTPGDYRAFWRAFSSVDLGSVQATDGELTARAEVTFVADDGEVFAEVHDIVLVEGPGGELLVDSDRAV